MTKHHPKCPNFNGPCCPWMGECDCQCKCDFINEIVEWDRENNPTRRVTWISDEKMREIFEELVYLRSIVLDKNADERVEYTHEDNN